MERLHYHPLSPYSRKASVAALMRGERCEIVEITLGTGALRRPEFLAISPFGKIPVLETDLPGVGNLCESSSIIELWEERGPRVLLPLGSERVARHFDRIGDLYLIASVAVLWWEPGSEAAGPARESAATAWRVLEDALADGRPFLAGDALTLADLGAAIATDYLARLHVEPPAAIVAWCARCFKVPAMAQSLAAAMPCIKKYHPDARGG